MTLIPKRSHIHQLRRAAYSSGNDNSFTDKIAKLFDSVQDLFTRFR